MQEFSSVIASSYDADSLAPILTEKARDGWSVVSIVAAGTNVVAYLSRDAGTSDADAAPADSTTTEPADAPTQVFTPSAAAAVEEPAGWGAVDDGPASMETIDTQTSADRGAADDAGGNDVGTAVTGAAALSDLGTESGASTTTDDDTTTGATGTTDTTDTTETTDTPGTTETAAAAETAAATEDEAASEAAPADSGVPAGWYADPSGRYELRYWDGSAWTEHVSRAGQQYTDPPVA